MKFKTAIKIILTVLALSIGYVNADETITINYTEVLEYTDGTTIQNGALERYKVYNNGVLLVSLEPDVLTYSNVFPDGDYLFTVTSVALVNGEMRESVHSNSAAITLPTKTPKAPGITVTVTVVVSG